MEDSVGMTGLGQMRPSVTWKGKDPPSQGGTQVLCGQALGVTVLCQFSSSDTSQHDKGLRLLNFPLHVPISSI